MCERALYERRKISRVSVIMFDSPVYTVIGFLGAWWMIIVIIFKIIGCARVHLLPKLTGKRVDLVNRYGAWAVVTGSTAGIGKAYAMELAKRGVNIILISRNVEKLNDVAEEIRKTYSVSTKIIKTDFSKGFSGYKELERELDDIKVPIGILVNNLSMFFSHPLYFTEVPPKMIDVIVNVNVNSALMMTRILLPKMQVQRKGAIIFVSSISELSSHPLNTLYSSTKRFIRSFSEGLRPDCNKFGITVQRLTPSLVKTKLNQFTKRYLGFDDFLVPNAEMYASAAISTLGLSSVTCGFWPHELQYFVANLLPRALSDRANERLALQYKNDYLRRQKRKMAVRNSFIFRV